MRAIFTSTSIESSLESKFVRFLLIFSMIFENAAIIFDILTNKLSGFKVFETIECSNSKIRACFEPILDCCNPIKTRIAISRSFFLKKSSIFFMLTKKPTNSN